MKKRQKSIFKTLFLICFLSVSITTFSQDIVWYSNGDSTICKISNITTDTLYMKVEVRNNIVQTYINIDKVKDYQFQVIETVKSENDTAASFFIVLNDGTGLTGKVIGFDKNSTPVKS